MKNELYHYVGGIIDGEGTISCDKREYINKKSVKKTYYYISIRIGMSGRAGKKTLDRIQEIVGLGDIYEHRGVYTYVAHGGVAKAFLERVGPYCYSKQDQVQAARSFFEKGANKESIYWRLRYEKQISYK
ncbi:hypothetical protein SAMN05192533_102307 [Mesobacillus persicus]|uniref:Homing endonuclease LAGLIDADG domain-containing protein n=1 Tax=Mesobacillus persicus TaxID=930146 RepID=A0A1H7XQ52_9BACI|nr:hypothetical protein [Mesobacillus persicus]SEM35754.1 hypothetical protein SAMN05192533_102307 [Mesobacillus persicus]